MPSSAKEGETIQVKIGGSTDICFSDHYRVVVYLSAERCYDGDPSSRTVDCRIPDNILLTYPDGKLQAYVWVDQNKDNRVQDSERSDYREIQILPATECDKYSYRECSSPYDFGTSSGTKQNMCGYNVQYYKVSTPPGKKCDITWKLNPSSGVDYDMWVEWEDKCPGTVPTGCANTKGTGQEETCSKTSFSGVSWARALKISGTGSYNISVSLNCVSETTTTRTTTTQTATTTLTTTSTARTTTTLPSCPYYCMDPTQCGDTGGSCEPGYSCAFSYDCCCQVSTTGRILTLWDLIKSLLGIR
jgi:hypothetical protein